MDKHKYNLLLADDDEDDCAFFREALDELPLSAVLKTVSDGVELMGFLLEKPSKNLPDILFLDLNMPRKSGFECLKEIKEIDTLKQLPIIVFSTSLDMGIVDLMYQRGAILYIRKPGEFSKLKKVIGDALDISVENNFKQPTREHFLLQP